MRLSLNKNALKQQRDHLTMYRRFLPSLDLKRQQLLSAHKTARVQLAELEAELDDYLQSLESMFPTLGSSTINPDKLKQLVQVRGVLLDEENVVGTHVPVVRGIEIVRMDYSMLTLPFWVDQLADGLEQVARLRVHVQVSAARAKKLGAAARKITQRVNLFEKVLIPKAESNIKRIGIALSDQERASVVRSKLAKRKHKS